MGGQTVTRSNATEPLLFCKNSQAALSAKTLLARYLCSPRASLPFSSTTFGDSSFQSSYCNQSIQDAPARERMRSPTSVNCTPPVITSPFASYLVDTTLATDEVITTRLTFEAYFLMLSRIPTVPLTAGPMRSKRRSLSAPCAPRLLRPQSTHLADHPP